MTKISPEVAALRKEGGGRGLSQRLSDRAFWIPLEVSESLVEALAAFDKAHGGKDEAAKAAAKAALCSELRVKEWPLSGIVGWYLADLLERYELKRPPHKPRTPLYDMSEADISLHLAYEAMLRLLRGYTSKGELAKNAAPKAAAEAAEESNAIYSGPRVSKEKLLRYHAGRLGSERARKKKLPPDGRP
jgi:hypothetical protein